MPTTKLLQAATTTGQGASVSAPSVTKTFQAYGSTSSGSGAATILVKGRVQGGVPWDTIGTITLTLSASATADANSDGFTSNDRYTELCGDITAISGPDASVNLAMGY